MGEHPGVAKGTDPKEGDKAKGGGGERRCFDREVPEIDRNHSQYTFKGLFHILSLSSLSLQSVTEDDRKKAEEEQAKLAAMPSWKRDLVLKKKEEAK